MLRIGEGYDIHRLAVPGPLRLGCVDIEYAKGVVGHSDGDALAHAICDALLGALSLGDMGRWFPSSDERWSNVDSIIFLRRVAELVGENGARIVNIDSTVILEQPRLGPFLAPMRAALSQALGCELERISVKAKSADGLGPIGSGEAVSAHAITLLERP